MVLKKLKSELSKYIRVISTMAPPSNALSKGKSKETAKKSKAKENLPDANGETGGNQEKTANGGERDPLHIFQSLDEATEGGKKRLSIEDIYQKKTQLEHILLRPSTYIGSVDPQLEKLWVYDAELEKMVCKNVSYIPGLYKIFDEIVVNAADNKQRDSTMSTIKININPEKNVISVWNNGRGIPVVEHRVEKIYVPEMIFGTLLTSSNYNDSENRLTGGLNGFGAKLCNIFSTEFTVETSSKEYGKSFKQTWCDNMGSTGKPIIKDSKGDDFTCVTFSPDLSKFGMEKLDDDIVALMSRRAYDLAGSTQGVTVFLNGKKLPVKGFKQYVELYTKGRTDDDGQQIKVVFDEPHARWQIAVTVSEHGTFQQTSFVNSIATMKGGRHIDFVADKVVDKLVDLIKKKTTKLAVNIRAPQIKNHMWIFVNCLIVNPTFDSQTKENMTLPAKSFGSKFELGEKFTDQVKKCGIVESIMSWLHGKAQAQLDKQCHATKHSKLNIEKLEDANDAGTKNSHQCTLILTEGDSAKALAVAGLSVVGRDIYGVFPLKGKMLNVREASHKQIMGNQEIEKLVKIVGLQYKKAYNTTEELKTLRYGKIMIMTDQDQDGSHIKGLLINFIHHNWPSLLRHNFLEEFITPIVKVTRGKEEISFYSIPEYEEWKASTADWNKWKIKYYKGLGTSTSKEAREYFANMKRHQIRFKYSGEADDRALDLAFSKKKIEERKDWLTKWMEERKTRKEDNLPDIYLYEKDTNAVTYHDFVNKELVLFSNMDNERSIPSLVDGLKPGQRKVMFTCFKRNDKREVKVAQLAGSVAEMSAYHHGEASLMSTIINLAQNFVGSNNINLLLPNGQFGTRLKAGGDAASPRYIFTMLNPVTRAIFNPADEPCLSYTFDDNKKIEPEYYVPIVPMVLINGTEGIGTGWSTKIPLFNPRDVVKNVERLLAGEPLLEMVNTKPWYKNYRGTIERLGPQRYIDSGEIGLLDDQTIEITEIPHDISLEKYKDILDKEPLGSGTNDKPALIQDMRDYSTENTVRFVVKMTPENLAKCEREGLHRVFKLQSSITLTSMVLFDADGCLRKFDTVDDILREFYAVRLKMYENRKSYLDGLLQAESKRLSNQARFILEKIEGKIQLEKKNKRQIVEQLIERNYDPDPVKKWKDEEKKKEKNAAGEESQDEQSDENEEAAADQDVEDTRMQDFNYLVTMTLIRLSNEEVAKLLKQRDDKLAELETLRSKSPTDLWREDLAQFMEALDKQEAKEREDEAAVALHGSTAAVGKKTKGAVGGGKKKVAPRPETMPTPQIRRVIPVIDLVTKEKFEKADKAKENKAAGITKERKPKKTKGEDDLDNSVTPVKRRKGASDEVEPVPDDKGIKRFLTTKKPAEEPAVKKQRVQKAKKASSSLDEDADPYDITNMDSDESFKPASKKAKNTKTSKVDEKTAAPSNAGISTAPKPKAAKKKDESDDYEDDDVIIEDSDDSDDGKKAGKSTKTAPIKQRPARGRKVVYIESEPEDSDD